MEKPDDAGIKAMTAELLESDPEVKEQMEKIQEAMARVDRCVSACNVCIVGRILRA